METGVIDEFKVQHYEYVSTRSFEDTVAAFEAATGSVEEGGLAGTIAGASGKADFEARIHAKEGESGFMRFLTTDHGAWLKLMGLSAKAKMYTLGNPLIAETMIKHDLAAGLNVPVRMMIYEDAASVTRLTYDLPSSLMSHLRNEQVTEAAQKLDSKLAALAEHVTGASA